MDARKSIFGLVASACLAVAASEVRFLSGDGRAFGGIGFQNAEAEIAVLMPDDFRDQRVLKSFREISPTFSRVYAGFADCPREQADRFADCVNRHSQQKDQQEKSDPESQGYAVFVFPELFQEIFHITPPENGSRT